MATTFLLLQPLTSERPPVRNTELPAGEAFNVALRSMASRDGFQTQWFGWQHPRRSPVNTNARDRFVWVVNWLDIASADALRSSDGLRSTFGNLDQFFEMPSPSLDKTTLVTDDTSSMLLTVQWTSGDATKLLNWTNRILVLEFQRSAPKVQGLPEKTDNGGSEEQDKWLARGIILDSFSQEGVSTNWMIEMKSIQPDAPDDEPPFVDRTFEPPTSIGNSIAVSLTRTRWCTRIREGLMESISARRVD